MVLILGDLIGKACVVYVDDILVYGCDQDEHDANLKSVLERLDEFNLKENRSKRCKCVNSIKFLGFTISYNKITPNPERSQGIVNYKETSKKKELQRFLGLVNYDRHFIDKMSVKLQELYNLLNRQTKFNGAKSKKVLLR